MICLTVAAGLTWLGNSSRSLERTSSKLWPWMAAAAAWLWPPPPKWAATSATFTASPVERATIWILSFSLTRRKRASGSRRSRSLWARVDSSSV